LVFQYNDFVNLMTYDLHGSWQSQTGIHAALFPGPNDSGTGNVDSSVQLLLSKGVPKEKLIMGMPAYGNAFRLNNVNNNGVGASAVGSGSIKYRDICSRINSGQLNYRWEDAQRVPYAFAGVEWVGYDDVRSITEKANYIVEHDLGGGMFWAIDNDDYLNGCQAGKFPLISTAKSIIIGRASTTATTNPPATTSGSTITSTASSTSNPGAFICPKDGLFKHPDCTKFYNCAHGTAYVMSCQTNLRYNVNGYCDWPYNVPC